MIYLDNAATSFPKAPPVGAAMAKYVMEEAANPGRAGHRMATAAEQRLDDLRLRLTRFIDADDPRRLVFACNTTDALNMAIKGVIGGLERRTALPHVVTTALEHNSVSRPLVALAQAGVIELTQVASDGEGLVDPQAIADAVTPATCLIAMTHASNVVGTIQDVAAVGQIARDRDVLFLLDAAQTLGAVPVSVRKMKVDLLAFPGHKSLLGPTGTGGLYVGERCPAASALGPGLRPWREGGTGGDSDTPTQPTGWPYFLEGGTPNTVGLAGLAAALDYVTTHDPAASLLREQELAQQMIDSLEGDDRFTLYGPRDARRRTPTLSLNVAGYEAGDVAAILDDSFEIAVRSGLHCAPYMHKVLGTFPSGAVRISPGPFTTAQEVASLIEALRAIAG